jgi:hypothetical protein
MWKINV